MGPYIYNIKCVCYNYIIPVWLEEEDRGWNTRNKDMGKNSDKELKE